MTEIVVEKEFRVRVRMRVHSDKEKTVALEHLRRRITQAIPSRRLHTMSGYVVEMLDTKVSDA